MSLGKKIKQLRTNKNISQQELAKLVKTSQSSVSQLEQDEITPLFTTVQRYAKVLGVSVGELINEDLSKEILEKSQ